MAGKRGKCKCGAPITLPLVEPVAVQAATHDFDSQVSDLTEAKLNRERSQELADISWTGNRKSRAHSFNALHSVAVVLRFLALLSIALALVGPAAAAALYRAGLIECVVIAVAFAGSALWNYASAEMIELIIGVALDIRAMRERPFSEREP